MKKLLDRIFIDGLTVWPRAVCYSDHSTIIQQIGTYCGGNIGNLIFTLGKVAAGLTGAGIGAGVARKLDAGHLVIVSAAAVGMIGAFAGDVMSGDILSGGNLVLSGPGRTSRSIVASYIAIEIGILISGKTRLDIILTPLVCIGAGSAVGPSGRSADFRIYVMAWFTDQLGYGTAAPSHGDCGIGTDGNDSDPADQFRGVGRDPESLGAGGRCGDRGMLLAI